jgi:hypothetical protein
MTHRLAVVTHRFACPRTSRNRCATAGTGA